MAILAVKINHLETLRMNEFFDYSGYCWALSRNREQDGAMGAELEDFYEGTVRSSQMEEIPVVFVYDNQIVGWYRKAVIYRYIRHPALFLEGNICANIRDVRFLKYPQKFHDIFFTEGKDYLVIETSDIRYEMLLRVIEADQGPFEAVDYAKVPVDVRIKQKNHVYAKKGQRLTAKDRVYHLLNLCETLTQEIMNDRCYGIGTVKALVELALEATRLDAKEVNAWYYLAMGYYQLGFVQKGLKAIDRALHMESDADDLFVMKGHLMVSKGCLERALECYENAYQFCPDDTYYIMAGKACGCMGNRIAADQYYRKVKDMEILSDFGITLTKKKQKRY